MKLLYITNQICGSGGLERVLSIKASFLANKLNYDVHFITINQGENPLFYNFSRKLNYHDLKINLSNPFSYLGKIKKKVKEINPDIISVCDDGIKGFFLPLILNRPCPMVYERHASKNIFITSDKPTIISKLKISLFNILMNYGASKYDSFVVLTNDNLKEWKLKNLKVIANPLSFFPKEKSTLKNKKAIAVGSHNFQKGFDRLLLVWENIAKSHPDWTLDIYGKIDKQKSYINLAKKLKLDNFVNFHAPVKNIADKYREASIFLMSSRSEGFGMVLIEAMANGVPCISFECPSGPKDIINEDKDGFLVTNGDLDKFTRRLEQLIEDEELRIRLGKNAILKAQAYLPENIVPEWDTLFRNLIKVS